MVQNSENKNKTRLKFIDSNPEKDFVETIPEEEVFR